jgi:DNA-binding transcriptional MerR regulator
MSETAVRDHSLPNKVYFRIGEVSKLVGVEPYVLRYWESEFAALRPVKSPTQQRLYRKHDIELLLKIKRLLYDEKFTIAGAKKQLTRGDRKDTSPQLDLQLSPGTNEKLLLLIERELNNLLQLLDKTK